MRPSFFSCRRTSLLAASTPAKRGLRRSAKTCPQGKLGAVKGAARMLAVLATALPLAVSYPEVHAATNRAHASRAHTTRHHSPRASEAIVGGHFARTGQFPWLARVLARR